METRDGIVWHVPYRPDTDRYCFPLPQPVADSIERSFRPVWHRYLDRSSNEKGIALLDVLDGWWIVFGTMLPILKDLDQTEDRSQDIEEKIYGLHTALQRLHEDLIDLIEFGTATLPYDPVVIKAVQKAMREYPELFAAAADEQDEEDVDAAGPVPPENDGVPVQ